MYSPPDPTDNLGHYMRLIQTYPMLTADEEQSLARRWVEEQDEAAANRLVTSHLRLVVKIAMGFRGYGMPVSEMISEGNIGLVQAVNRFDPYRGFRLSTYAMWWIRASIQEYILHSWSLVRLGTTAQQKKLFFNLRRLKAQMQAMEAGHMSPEQVAQVAEALNVSQHEVISMNTRISHPDRSLNVPLRQDGEDEWQDWLVDTDDNQEQMLGDFEQHRYRKGLLDDALEDLSARERDIVRERRLRERPLTLEQLSSRYGISRERVRQIEVAAVEKLKKSVVATHDRNPN